MEFSLTEEHKRNAILRIALNLSKGGTVDEGVDDVQGDQEYSHSAKQKLEKNNRRIDHL